MADQGAVGEIPGNPTVGVGMYGQARHNVNPGYVRRLHAGPYDPLALQSGVFAQITSGQMREREGSNGVNFGLGPIGANKRTDLGSPAQPSQLQHGPGRTLMLIPASAGARVISLDARFYPDSGVGFRPRLLAKRDLEIGIQDDASAEAGTGGGLTFVTISLSLTLSQDGVVELYREQQDQRADAWVIWDNLAVS